MKVDAAEKLREWARKHAQALARTIDEDADMRLAAAIEAGSGKSGRRLKK